MFLVVVIAVICGEIRRHVMKKYKSVSVMPPRTLSQAHQCLFAGDRIWNNLGIRATFESAVLKKRISPPKALLIQ